MSSAKRKLKVVIVDDSMIVRRSLESILTADGDIEVVGTADDAFSASAVVEKLAPDLVTMDVQMPGKSGLEAVREIMTRCPTPLLVVTAQRVDEASGMVFEAVRNGALDVVSKPSITDDVAGAELRSLVRSLAAIPVSKLVSDARTTVAPAAPKASPEGAPYPRREIVVLVAGSSGMPPVLAMVTRLPVLRCPVVLHQPVPTSLISSYAQYLGRVTKNAVRLATTAGEVPLTPGELVVIPGRKATCFAKGIANVSGVEASATPLLRSIAQTYGERALAIALGGRGTDVDGFVALRKVGGTVLAHDAGSGDAAELTRCAMSADAVSATGDIEAIVERLLRTSGLT